MEVGIKNSVTCKKICSSVCEQKQQYTGWQMFCKHFRKFKGMALNYVDKKRHCRFRENTT